MISDIFCDMAVSTTRIEQELVSSYLDYSMSVIMGRAIPDVRDGLKPVQRRILWTMWEEGITSRSPYRKSAKIVGSCIGKYHPHGDAPVYDALVRMAQDFTMRYPLVDGQGNFGSIDGDEPAAMRYTEARLSAIAEELLKDIHENTVNFVPNYDESLLQPEYLPARFPNILVNGASGIAVGMSTSIPPHNLSEVCDACAFVVENPNAALDDILKFIKGPDFPTGGLVIGDIRQVYEEGRGYFTIYSRYKVEDGGRYKRIVFWEVPYQENKARIVEKIARLKETIPDIVNVRDESDRRGIRIVVEVKKNADEKEIVAMLYSKTNLKVNYFVNMLVIDNKAPQQMNLVEIIKRFVEFRREVVLRRTRFRLEKAKDRMHVLEGFLKAIDRIDDIIRTIRESDSPAEAKQKLQERFGFSERQAQAILDMKLQRLTRLERNQLLEEYEKVKKTIQELEKILSDEKELRKVIKQEILEIKEKYGDERRTQIAQKPPVEISKIERRLTQVKVAITYDDYISVFEKMESLPRGIPVKFLFLAESEKIGVISSDGKFYAFPVSDVKEWGKKGYPINKILKKMGSSKVVFAFPLDGEKDMVIVSARGVGKRIKAQDLKSGTKAGETIISLAQGDEVSSATFLDKEVFFITRKGMILGVKETDITPRVSKLVELSGKDDRVVCVLSPDNKELLVVATEKGYVKAVRREELKVQSKGTRGIQLVPDNAGYITSAVFVSPSDSIFITYIAENGKVSVRKEEVKKLKVVSRYALGEKFENGKPISLCVVI